MVIRMASEYNSNEFAEVVGELSLDRRLNASFSYDSSERIVRYEAPVKETSNRPDNHGLAFTFEF